MFVGLLASIGKFAFQTVGGHLLSSSPVTKLEAAVSGLGARFALGFGSGFYVLNADFRGGADQCIKAVLEAVKGLI